MVDLRSASGMHLLRHDDRFQDETLSCPQPVIWRGALEPNFRVSNTPSQDLWTFEQGGLRCMYWRDSGSISFVSHWHDWWPVCLVLSNKRDLSGMISWTKRCTFVTRRGWSRVLHAIYGTSMADRPRDSCACNESLDRLSLSVSIVLGARYNGLVLLLGDNVRDHEVLLLASETWEVESGFTLDGEDLADLEM